MDGAFMRKFVRRIVFCLLIVLIFWCGTLIADRHKLGRDLIRLHVVANSDAETDQQWKLKVRDAVLESIQKDLAGIANPEAAQTYIREKLPYIRNVAEKTLRELGCDDAVQVSLCRESFDTRVYDTFTLPAGVYNSLRIIIGEGTGKNWWCVVFPEFCMPSGASDVETVAAGAGFSNSLRKSLTGEDGYELRFGILDAMGKLENLLFKGFD